MKTGESFKKILELSREQPGYQAGIILMGLGSAIISSSIPFIVKDLFDNLFRMSLRHAMGAIGCILILYSLSVAVELAGGFISNVAETKMGALLKRRLLLHAIHLPWMYYQSHGKGEVLSRAVSDTEQVGRNISVLPALIIEVATLLIAGTVLLRLNITLGLIALATIPIYYLSMHCFVNQLKQASNKEREEYTRSVELFRDCLDGLQEINLFNASGHFMIKLARILGAWVQRVKSTALYQTANYGVQTYLSTLFPLIALGVGLTMARKGIGTTGTVIATFTYLGHLYRPIERIAFIWSLVLRSMPVMDRIYELLGYPIPVQSGGLCLGRYDVELVGVRWSYNEYDVLVDISLSVRMGEKIAIVGQSGAGKSTIAWLLLGLFQPQTGEVRIGGNPLSAYKIEELRHGIGYTSANPHIFQGTLTENVTLGLNCSPKEVTMVLSACGLSDIPPEQMIGEGEGDLSLGQKQRIGLARVMLRRPRIIILDEATSSIDSQTEEKILGKIFTLDSTVIVMSHRLSTVKHCPRVALLQNGRIVKVGTHDELVATNESYREIFREQLAAVAS